MSACSGNCGMIRSADAVDQARVIAFLASRDADFGTGVNIDVTVRL